MNNQYFNPYFNNYGTQTPYSNNGNLNNFSNINNNNLNNANNVNALIVVNGLDGAKNYIMPPSKTIYLKDAYNNILYKKTSDEMCNITLTAFKLTEIKLDDIQNGNINNNNDYVLKNDFATFSDNIFKRLNAIETSLKGGISNE